MNKKIDTYNRKAASAELKNYCSFAKENDFMEVTEWNNGEGFDYVINNDQVKQFTYGEYAALKKLVKKLDDSI